MCQTPYYAFEIAAVSNSLPSLRNSDSGPYSQLAEEFTFYFGKKINAFTKKNPFLLSNIQNTSESTLILSALPPNTKEDISPTRHQSKANPSTCSLL